MANSRWTLEACALYTRGGTPPAPDHDASFAARQDRLAAEKQRLVDYARACRALRDSDRDFPADTEGGEHKVFHLVHAKRYLKATLSRKQLGYGIALGSFIRGATPSEYLDRLDLHNEIFDDDVRLEYVMANGSTPVIVTSQPAIIGEHPTQSFIDGVMVKLRGLELMAEGAYYDAKLGVLIYDLFPRNVYVSAEGQMLPIDPVIQRIDPDFADFLRQDPSVINRGT